MTRKVDPVRYHLDTKGIRDLPFKEIQVILRGADDLIMRGGRSLLVKILKGSRARDVIEKGLDRSPVYGYYKEHSADDVRARIDWLIQRKYLAIEYDYRLPLLVYAPTGWEIEKETYTEELFQKLSTLTSAAATVDMSFLKDRNRDMILLLLEKIAARADASFIPLLEAWAQIDYKKIRQELRAIIQQLAAKHPSV